MCNILHIDVNFFPKLYENCLNAGLCRGCLGHSAGPRFQSSGAMRGVHHFLGEHLRIRKAVMPTRIIRSTAGQRESVNNAVVSAHPSEPVAEVPVVATRPCGVYQY